LHVSDDFVESLEISITYHSDCQFHSSPPTGSLPQSTQPRIQKYAKDFQAIGKDVAANPHGQKKKQQSDDAHHPRKPSIQLPKRIRIRGPEVRKLRSACQFAGVSPKAVGHVGQGNEAQKQSTGSGVLGSSIVASVSVQQGQAISPKRIGHTLGHSAYRRDSSLWVVDRNDDNIPLGKRQHSGIHDKNPYFPEQSKKAPGSTSQGFYLTSEERVDIGDMQSSWYNLIELALYAGGLEYFVNLLFGSVI
jgi:hypothetical protein